MNAPAAAIAAMMSLLACCSVYGGDAVVDRSGTAETIDAILYSGASKEEMLEQLKPFVAVGDSVATFKDKTGLELGFCLIGGPGVQDCSIARCGLVLILDPFDRIRIIRRATRTVRGKEYQQMSISTNSFEWNGYRRGYYD